MNCLRPISISIILLLFCFTSKGQNHRQYSNWLCGDYTINKIVDGISSFIGEAHIINLSNIDSSNYWLVEDLSVSKTKRQRLLHVILLDSGYVGVDVFDLKNDKSVQTITSFKQIKLDEYKKANLSNLIFYYNRPARGFEIMKSENRFFYLDKFIFRVACCNEFSAFYFDALTKESELILIKRVD
jgi:hypothetical protein